jgi:adenylate kinase family enzyme
MGLRNYLIEGVSGAGKTTVAEALERRGHHVLHGDRTLAYLGDPATGEAMERPARGVTDQVRWRHEHWIWDVAKTRSAIADRRHPRTFFCGGARNHRHFIGLFDRVFVLDIDIETLNQRLAGRPKDAFGGRPEERRLIASLHASKADIPENAVAIDAMGPVARIVDEILSKCDEAERGEHAT